jgi:hypothetical protein
MKRLVIAAATMAALSACAQNPASIAPAYTDYSTMSCAQARANLPQARANEASLSQTQSNAAMTDAATVFLILVPVSSLTGQNVAGELAQAKGVVDALEARLMSC